MQDAERSKEFGRLLREYRLQRGLTQDALAEQAGLGRRSIQGLEQGESVPHRGTLQRLMQALALSSSDRVRLEAAAKPSPRHRRSSITRESIPALSPLHRGLSLLHNLPAQLTSFIGREEEIREIQSLLATKRLVTLMGTGGCGKTRLALQVASEVVGIYPDGVWLVELAPHSDPDLVTPSILAALGIQCPPDRPILTHLAETLGSRQLLLLLDNCEHLIDACVQIATSLLQTCPGLSILTTSRQPLQVFGEVQWHVPSLPTPDPTSLTDSSAALANKGSAYPAIQLFVERAQAVQPTFVLSSPIFPAVVQICWQLDGLPLAIELAAARVRGLSVEAIADRLDRRFQLLTNGSRVALPRQRTLQATIDWSYELLAPKERLLFRRLAVFAGGFTVEAAEGICGGDDLAVEEVLLALLRLVDQSLVEVVGGDGTARYRLLETIREYGLGRLAATVEVEVLRRKHHAWYLAWAKEAETHIWGPEQRVWLDRLEREHDNLRAALHDYEDGDVASGLRLASYLHRFWVDRGHLVEGQRWLADLLERACDDSRTRGMALAALGRIRLARADLPEAILALEEALGLLRAGGQSRDLAYALHWLGAAVLATGDDDTRALLLLEECIEIFRAIGDLTHQGASVGYLGNLAFVRGDRQKAREQYLEGLSLVREVGALRVVAWLLRCLGILARSEGDHRQARELLTESLDLSWEVGYGVGIVGALTNFAILAEQHGGHRRAVRLIATATRDSLPVLASRLERSERDNSLAVSRDALGEQAFAQVWAEGQAMTLEQAVAYALGEDSG